MKSLAPSEAAPALINWRRCAEHHQQRSKAYEEQIAKLYAAVNEQNEIIKKLGMSRLNLTVTKMTSYFSQRNW